MNYKDYDNKKVIFIEDLKKIKINNETILEFKKNRIGLNLYEDNYINEVINALKLRSLNNLILQQYIREIEVINTLYNEYYNSNINKEIIKFIDKKTILGIAFLINEIAYNNNRRISDKKVKKSIIDIIDIYNSAENIYINGSNIIKYYNHIKNIDFNRKVKIKRIRIKKNIENNIVLSAQLLSIFDIIVGMWQIDCLKILCKNKDIYLKLKNIEKFKQSYIRENIYTLQQEINEEYSLNFKKLTSGTKYGNFIIKQECSSYIDLINMFYNKKLDDKLLNIEYSTWLRFLSLLIEKANYISNDKFLITKIYVKNMKNWIKWFEKNGIDRKEAELMINELIFYDKSIDYFDSPFFKVNKGLAIIPEIVKLIKPSRTIESIMTRTNSKDNKGNNFEKYVCSILKYNKFQFVTLKERVNKEEFQCDVVFIRNNEIFFCELKNENFPRSYKKYIASLENIEKYKSQIYRIYEHFKKNKLVGYKFREKYGENSEYNENLKPIKMIIMSNIIEKKYHVEKMIITDVYNLRMILNRIKQDESLFSTLTKNDRFHLFTDDDEIIRGDISLQYGDKFNVIHGEFIKDNTGFEYSNNSLYFCEQLLKRNFKKKLLKNSYPLSEKEEIFSYIDEK